MDFHKISVSSSGSNSRCVFAVNLGSAKLENTVSMEGWHGNRLQPTWHLVLRRRFNSMKWELIS